MSALTNPDGTYTINGLPPGQYLLYAHPLPQDAVPLTAAGWCCRRIWPDICSTRRLASSRRSFIRHQDYNQATTFTVTAGQALTGEDFVVQPRTSRPTYDLVTWFWVDPVTRTYSYNEQNLATVTPAYGTTSQQYLRIIAEGNYQTVTPLPKTAALLGSGYAPSRDIQSYQPFKNNPSAPC